MRLFPAASVSLAICCLLLGPGSSVAAASAEKPTRALRLSADPADIAIMAAGDPLVAIPKLGRLLRETASSPPGTVDERLTVHRQVRQTLVGIPGHARYYGDAIALQGGEVAGLIEGPDSPPIGTEEAKALAFETLAQLPSLETIMVLGELLFDDRGGPQFVGELPGGHTTASISLCAARALGRLVEAPPLSKSWVAFTAEDVAIWRSWYASLRAGAAAFRFRGDAHDYRLAEPVRAIAPISASMPFTLGGEGNPSVRIVIFVVGSLGLLWIFSLCQILRSGRRDEG